MWDSHILSTNAAADCISSEHSLPLAYVIKYVTPPHLALASWLSHGHLDRRFYLDVHDLANRTGADTADVNSELNWYMTEPHFKHTGCESS